MHGIDLEAAATLFKILHNILPTKDRTDKQSRKTGPLLGKCTFCPQFTDDIVHMLTLCKQSAEAANCLLRIIRIIDDKVTLVDAIFLQGTWGLRQLPIAWLVALSFHLIWTRRQNGGILPLKLHAELTARAAILAKTKFFEDSLIITRALSQSA